MKCDHHDYIEIACMYRYLVELSLVNGEKVQGKAIDTRWNESQQECIQIKQDDADHLVVLESIAQMKVLTENPHITSIKFID